MISHIETWCSIHNTRRTLNSSNVCSTEQLARMPGFWKMMFEDRLKKMKLQSRAFQLWGDAIEIYKYLHGIYWVDSTELLTLYTKEGVATRGQYLKLQKKKCRTALLVDTFAMRVVNSWNWLLEDIVQAPSVSAFKNRYDKFSILLPQFLMMNWFSRWFIIAQASRK